LLYTDPMPTAIGSYVTTATAKARLGIPSADTTDDTMIGKVCDQVNAYIESYTGTVLAPIAGTLTKTFDGYECTTNRILLIPRGVRTITLLENSAYTGGPFQTIPSTDYFLRPTDFDLNPGYPYTELVMTNVPSAGNPLPTFNPGMDNIRITGTWGWPQIPDEIKEIAEVMTVRAWAGRQGGQTDQIGVSEGGMPIISRTVSLRDRETLGRFRLKRPDEIGPNK
jgi:hypothetical protein